MCHAKYSNYPSLLTKFVLKFAREVCKSGKGKGVAVLNTIDYFLKLPSMILPSLLKLLIKKTNCSY